MNRRAKTALFVTVLNVALTVLKFIAHSLTGSVAVLADAWHSFADITTSALVLFSIIGITRTLGMSKQSGQSEDSNDRDIPPHSESLFEKNGHEASVSGNATARFSKELKVAFGIGLFLLTVSVLIFIKAARPSVTSVSNSMVVGILFLVFSFCSYGIYRYETRVGQLENSMGLMADGMHSKADMIASLLTGLSLLLYTFGLDVDRFAALLIGLFIFYIASELLVNSIVSSRKPTGQSAYLYNFPVIMASILQPASWKAMADALSKKLNLGQTGSKIISRTAKLAVLGVVLAVAWILAMNCIYVIGPKQEGIVERFGRPLHYGQSVSPGLHFKLPWPVDKVIKKDVKTVRAVNIGTVGSENIYALLWTRKHAHEDPFLSSNNSFFYPYVVVNYIVKDIFQYTYRHQFPDELVKNVANRVISGIFVTKSFYEIATTYRRQLEIDVVCLLQADLNRLGCGIEIVDVYLKDIHPPIPIAPSFEQVIAAFQEKRQIINDAHGYRNKAIPRARGNAVRAENEAIAYSIEKRQNAAGETARFLSRLAAFHSEKTITRKRLYLDAMKDALAKNRKILIDPSSGIPELWIGFQDFTSMNSFDDND